MKEDREHDHFDEFIAEEGKDSLLAVLGFHEQHGTLKEYIKEVAPDYIENGEVYVFTLISDLGL